MKCGELMYGRFPQKPKRAVYESYLKPATLYEGEAWCLKETWTLHKGQKDAW